MSGAVASADARAAKAQQAILDRFVARFFHLPWTRLARTVAPGDTIDHVVSVDRATPLHYWWQAHLLDVIVDSGLRNLRSGDKSGARASARLGRRLQRTVMLRNRGTVRNSYFDDMAWLALASGRLDELHRALRLRRGSRQRSYVQRTLTAELLGGLNGTGGVFWNKDRTFLAAAAAGPTSLHLARSGHTDESLAVVQWMESRLLNGDGLVIDGLRTNGTLEQQVYTYNQGPLLGTLLALGGRENLRRAAALLDAVAEQLCTAEHRTLRTHGLGDGGLFTGILVRYLALAAVDEQLNEASRSLAAELVGATAEALWDSRDALGNFSASTESALTTSTSASDVVELSTQLQGWMVMEALARVEAGGVQNPGPCGTMAS